MEASEAIVVRVAAVRIWIARAFITLESMKSAVVVTLVGEFNPVAHEADNRYSVNPSG